MLKAESCATSPECCSATSIGGIPMEGTLWAGGRITKLSAKVKVQLML